MWMNCRQRKIRVKVEIYDNGTTQEVHCCAREAKLDKLRSDACKQVEQRQHPGPSALASFSLEPAVIRRLKLKHYHCVFFARQTTTW